MYQKSGPENKKLEADRKNGGNVKNKEMLTIGCKLAARSTPKFATTMGVAIVLVGSKQT